MKPPYRQHRRRFPQLPTVDFIAAIVGLVIALLLSVLLSFPLAMLPDIWGQISPMIAGVFLCIVITTITVAQGRELFALFGVSIPEGVERSFRISRGDVVPRSGQIIVDTSALIDGRIADIIQAGFISGPLVIPRFVLDELQHIADSYETTRRNRGRRGLEVLNKLQHESDTPVVISDVDIKGIPDVDSKLVKLATLIGSGILTNDYNLNQVAKIQGVQVLNVNELANAVRPVVLPGEEMLVHIIQEGKEAGQGLGFLNDGTMVVVEEGKGYIGESIEVTVTRVLQTSAGRMIFSQPKNNNEGKGAK